MAKKNRESAPIDKRAEAFGHKVRQIEAMARLVGQDACFRRALVDYFAGSKIARASVSTWLLEWFSRIAEWFEKKQLVAMLLAERTIRRRGQLGFVERADFRQCMKAHRLTNVPVFLRRKQRSKALSPRG